jgi:alanine racemase
VAAPEILLNMEHLFHNLRYLLSKSSAVFAVVKANAYGHGAWEITTNVEKNFSQKEIPYFCLARVGEVSLLRQQGLKRPCLVMSDWEFREDWPADCVPVIHSLEDVARIPAGQKKITKVHLKINTGMNRLGMDAANLASICEALAQLSAKGIVIEGLMSHLARAEVEPEILSLDQEKKFKAIVEELLGSWQNAWGAKPIWIHLTNSEGLFHDVGLKTPFNAARSGLGLWGIQESLTVPHRNHEIKPVLEVRARVRKIFEVESGVGVGYGHSYLTKGKRRLATVVLGYADGLRRDLAREGALMFQGAKLPFVGRISMDLCTVDATDSSLQEGDWVHWIGGGQSVEALASELGTISYEVLCGLSARVQRRVLTGGRAP